MQQEDEILDELLNEERFNYVSIANKAFILAFNYEMSSLGYDFGGKIGSGYCWGNHMVIYTKSGVKSKNVFARIYMRDTDIVLRMFFSNIDKHRNYIEKAPAYIKEVFTGDHARCNHDRDDGDGKCKFRKSYTIDGQLIEKCNGITFEFHEPDTDKLNDYIALFREFYPPKKVRLPVKN
jgi:hypothetical protein